MGEAAHKDYKCTRCDDRPNLNEKMAEDVVNLSKKCNEVLTMLTDLFLAGDKSGPDFQNVRKSNKVNNAREKRTVNNFHNTSLGGSVMNSKQIDINSINGNNFNFAHSLEDPFIEEAYHAIKKDEAKNKKFIEIVTFYSQK